MKYESYNNEYTEIIKKLSLKVSNSLLELGKDFNQLKKKRIKRQRNIQLIYLNKIWINYFKKNNEEKLTFKKHLVRMAN